MDLDLDVQHRPRSGRIPTAALPLPKQICTRNPSGIFAPTPASRQTAPPCPTGRPALAVASLRLWRRRWLWPTQRSCSPPFSGRPAEAPYRPFHYGRPLLCTAGCGLPAKRPPTALRRLRPSPIRPTRCVAAHWLATGLRLVSCLSKRPSWSQIQLAPRSTRGGSLASRNACGFAVLSLSSSAREKATLVNVCDIRALACYSPHSLTD